MSKPTRLIGMLFLAALCDASSQDLNQAEVRISYGELKQLLTRAEPTVKPKKPDPALLSARLVFSIENGRPVITGHFRIATFNDEFSLVPLITGDLALQTQEPAEAAVVAERNTLCLATEKPGTQTLQLRLLPIHRQDGFHLTIPPCPSVIFETADLPDDQSVILSTGDTEETLAAGAIRPLPNGGQTVAIRLLDSGETRKALAPPEPSTWSWQHQALVTPGESDLIYQMITRASAANGSGVAARLSLPPDAQDVTVAGEDLTSHSTVRGDNRTLALALQWKTRGLLDRQLMISYRMPLRPLDRSWTLQAPGDEDTRTRFIIANTPLLSYRTEGLSAQLTPQGLPAALAESLKGGTCQHLEGGTAAELMVNAIPVAATAEGVVNESAWLMKMEPDGATLLTGNLTVEHKGPLGFVFDTPEGMKLLSCESGGRPCHPVDLGDGKLMVPLSAAGQKTQLTCSFTGNINPLDPVEGTLKLSLPQTPLFIHSLIWNLEMPSGYQAETHGNLKRVTSTGPGSTIALRKNLCRDERPEVNVFYQRNNLNR